MDVTLDGLVISRMGDSRFSVCLFKIAPAGVEAISIFPVVTNSVRELLLLSNSRR